VDEHVRNPSRLALESAGQRDLGVHADARPIAEDTVDGGLDAEGVERAAIQLNLSSAASG
jgi:hypothetical protein